VLLAAALLVAPAASGARIKDIVEIHGERGNTVRGFGLVVGLDGTGDSALPSAQVLASLLRREASVTLNPSTLTSGNIALVFVSAELPPYAMEGSRIDITVSATGDAKSLQGGTLLPTELLGLDGEVYAVTLASAISTASWTVEGKTGSKVAKNHPTAGRIPGGAYIERAEISNIVEIIGGKRCVTFKLRNSDSTTAERIRQSIEALHAGVAFVQNAGTVRIRVPDEVGSAELNAFVDRLLQLNVEVDVAAIVVINEKTGTIVVGGNVGISETAVAQGSLVVKIKEQQFVSQPVAPLATSATTAVVPDSSVLVEEQEGSLIRVPNVVTVSDLVNALNAIGATPRDLIAIFNALKVAGALQAEVKIM